MPIGVRLGPHPHVVGVALLLGGLGHVRSVQLAAMESTQLELTLNELPMLLLPRIRRSVGRSLPQAGLTQRSSGRPRPPL